ncbi:MAG: response regulator [Gammaproteobacteria bacterium]|nr:response regulator [Gammaproteobacteria bacterium]MBI5615653.1 response regulator [Gammaproteobacteria bacterium]
MSERILLIVDDEENVLRALVRVLRRDGYRILTADGGAKGLEMLAATSGVGVIISDQRMPGMSGTEFLRNVRDHYPDTVRMMLSGYTELQVVTEAINEGAIYKFLTKPWDDEMLRANVREAFEHYDLRMENVRLTVALAKTNSMLSQRVSEQLRTLDINLRVLEASREMLERLPVAVIGIDEDGLVSVVNARGQALFDAQSGLVEGLPAANVLPPPLAAAVATCAGDDPDPGPLICDVDGRSCRVSTIRLGRDSRARGLMLVVEPLAAF